jgi:hypothetical protein
VSQENISGEAALDARGLERFCERADQDHDGDEREYETNDDEHCRVAFNAHREALSLARSCDSFRKGTVIGGEDASEDDHQASSYQGHHL